MIKVDDDVHAMLKRSGNIRQAIRELVLGSADLKTVLDQMHMRFDSLESLLPTVVSGDLASDSIVAETKQEAFLRIKAEREAIEKAQKHAIEHPEDADQSGGWA